MTRKSKSIVGIVILAFVLLIALRLIRTAGSTVESVGNHSVVPVSGIVITPGSYTRKIEETGTLVGNRESLIAAEVGGRVLKVYVETGEFVKSGAPLVRLDDELLELESERTKVAYDKAKLDFERVEKLHQENSISDSDLENARLGMKSAEVLYRLADKSYRDATVRAPFSGTIAAKMVEVGQTIERGVPVVQLVDLSLLKLTVQVSETDVSNIAAGAAALVIVESTGDTVAGNVSAIGTRAASGARTFPVEIRVNSKPGLLSGMFARAVIEANTVDGGALVPRAATLADAGQIVVYVASSGVAEKRIVRVLATKGDELAISGVIGGDTVITTGNQLISQGTAVKVSLEGATHP